MTGVQTCALPISNASNDSLVVNASSTRAASPSNASNTSSTSLLSKSPTPVNDNGGEPLTTEKLEELNQENAASDPVKVPDALPIIPEVPKRKVGYKNIPSLDAITARLAKARSSISVDGSAMPPEPQMIEDPKTPGVVMKAPEHPLQFSWYAHFLSCKMYADALVFNVGRYIMIRKGSIHTPLLPVLLHQVSINLYPVPQATPHPKLPFLSLTHRKAQNTKLG